MSKYSSQQIKDALKLIIDQWQNVGHWDIKDKLKYVIKIELTFNDGHVASDYSVYMPPQAIKIPGFSDNE